MSSMRSIRTGRSLTFISTLLLTTALAAPAFAQIEEVVVTAQKRAEDIQTVPIAVTAYTSEDLKAHQITEFKDLQFATPNVTYSQSQYSTNFQIRGIGVTTVGAGSESGVAINFADVFLASPTLDGASFYDLQDLEVLRGPQSTLYGRGATGGVVNIAPNRPDLDEYSVQVDGQYGNYNGSEVKGAVNLPIIAGELAARVSGDWIKHDGFTTNIADGSKQNDRDEYSVRGAVRWEPTDRTTIDFVGQFSQEDDHRARADKELCASDPTGTLGCTPASPTTGALNLNATYLNLLATKQGVAGVFAPQLGLQAITTGAGLAAITATGGGTPTSGELGQFLYQATNGGNVPALLAALPPTLSSAILKGYYGGGFAAGTGLGSAIGLTNTAAPYYTSGTLPPNSNPSNYRQVNDDFNPINKQQDNFMSVEVKQNILDWLDGTFVGGYDHGNYFNQQSFTNTFGPALGAANLAVAEGTFLGALAAPAAAGGFGRPDLAAAYAPYFTAVPGQLPVSDFHNLGISSGAINRYSPNISSYDQNSGSASQLSAELRFNSKFEGPLNFMVGGYYLDQHSLTDYYVGSNSLDYAGILLGGITAAVNDIPVAGLIAPSYYHSESRDVGLLSRGIFSEVYYDIVPDLLKLTVGGRYNSDVKTDENRIVVLTGFSPLGASNEDATLNGLQPYDVLHKTFNSTTGRVVLNYTPKLDFTDQTLFYASYAHGYKAGGFNAGLQAGISDLPPDYGPEKIDAYELGTKNVLLDGHLQANADVWYYDYQGLQVSSIIDNTSINQNIAAKLYGVEGEFVWLPTDNLQFNLNLADTHSAVNNGVSEVDERNPTGGDPRAILVKDNTLGAANSQNCVIYDMNPGPVALPTGYTLIPSASGPQLAQFVAPPGGQTALAGVGIANTSYGSCSTSPQLKAFLAAQGYSTTDPAVNGTQTGVPVNLGGNQLQQTPNLTISVGAQYTFNLDGGYTLVPRADYYWQSHMWGRIFHDPADLIKSWDVANAQITLNSPDKNWYVGAFIKNVFDKTYVTGEYLQSSSSGLYTNAFLGDPRTYGVQAGIHF